MTNTRRVTVRPMATFAAEWDLSGAHGAMCAACALHWYCVDYHGGQGSDLYALQCTLRYAPGPLESGPAPDSVDVDIYGALASGELEPHDVHAWINSQLREED